MSDARVRDDAVTIELNLSKPVRLGRTSFLLRAHKSDFIDIENASSLLGMTSTAFIRTVAIQSARSVLANGKEIRDAKAAKNKS